MVHFFYQGYLLANETTYIRDLCQYHITAQFSNNRIYQIPIIPIGYTDENISANDLLKSCAYSKASWPYPQTKALNHFF